IITISAAELTAETKSNVNISGPAPTLTESPELSFSAADRTIIRNEGSWVEDGFASGSYIVVEGAGENNGVYQIETVNDDILVLASAALLVAQENVKNVTVTVPDRIEFSDDNPGFQAGQLLSISGTQTNNRSVLIADALEVNGATWLMLSASSKLADESLQDDPDLKLTGRSIIRLSADATFEIDGVAVKVLAQPDSNSPYVSATSDNNNPFDLVNDINSALDKAGLKETIKAELNNGQIILTDISDTVGSPFVLTTEETNPAHTELGFATTQTADSADLLITLSDNTLEPYRITLDGATTIQEVINRIEAGTNNQVKVEVNPDTNAGLRLIQVPALTGNPRLSFDATANSILFDDVGLSWADYGFVADQQIRVSGASDDNDGTYTIDSITGHELKISGDSLAAQQSIKDVRITLAGSEIFRVEAINGSKAAGKLGILKADVSSDVDDSGKIDVEDSDGVIIGDAIAGGSILDRFFIQDPKVEGNVFINAGDAATDGITVTGDFGFISVDLNGYGAFDTTLTLDLDDPTPDVAGITVNELIDSLSHIDSIVSLPSIGGPEVSGEELIFADKTIVRSNNEVWDNFSVGEYISVTGAAEQNDGHYKISAIAGSILTLELDENFVSETITGATVLNEIGSFRFNLDVVPDFGLINEEQASALVVALFDFGNPFADTDFNSDEFTLGSDDKSVTLEGDWSDRIKAGADLIAELEASLFAGVVYVSENSFQLDGDQSKNFELGAKVTALLTAGAESKTVISKIKTINYDEASNQTTFTIQDSILTADLSSVSIVTNDVKTKVSSVSYDEAANETRVVTVDKVLTSAVNSLTVDTPREIDYLLQLPDLGELVKFDEIGISQILDGLIELSDFLGEFEAFGFLDEPIPIIDVSVNDVLSFADKFDAAVQEANNNPAGTLQVLEAKLKEALGIPSGSDSDALGFTERLSSESGILTGNALTDADVADLHNNAVFLLSLDNGPSQLIKVETDTADTIDELIVNVNAALSVAFAAKVQARRTGNDEIEFYTLDSESLAISNPIDFSIYQDGDLQMFRIDFGLGIGFTEALDVEFDLGDSGILSGAAGLEAS
ncbi:MAG: hypothetical protein KAT20_00030, partial [Desulfuromonadales bacterium]|nr:hypothetical protein [Desulfuromonadales bacterium]